MSLNTSHLRGSHGLSAWRPWMTKSSRPEGTKTHPKGHKLAPIGLHFYYGYFLIVARRTSMCTRWTWTWRWVKTEEMDNKLSTCVIDSSNCDWQLASPLTHLCFIASSMSHKLFTFCIQLMFLQYTIESEQWSVFKRDGCLMQLLNSNTHRSPISPSFDQWESKLWSNRPLS